MKLIDADALVLVLLRETSWYDNADEDIVYEIVHNAPTVDAVPVARGKWIFTTDYTSTCSTCKQEVWIDHEDEFSYCPDCGAKMEGTE